MARFALPALLCIAMLVNTGCTRTSDGTIVMADPTPPSAFRTPWWRRSQPQAPAYPPQPVLAAPTSPPPQSSVRRSPQRQGPTTNAGKSVEQFHGMRVGVRPPFTPSESGKALNCANKTQPGGRVKVVCE
ncbi:MAG: hypothetical protein M9924_14995 [Rhizobiaceae bacterium]|nr:hypothetical protein [Rhizobiaceae bacterium]